MAAASWLSAKVRKGLPSTISGRGLFAAESIETGEVVAVKGGHVVDRATLEALPGKLFETEIQITDELHLVALAPEERDDVMLFLNHSCEPNVGFGGNVALVAMSPIRPGDELTVDYAMFDVIGTEMTCRCGRPRCRGTITGRDWERPELQARYQGYFSWYLQRRIDRAAHAAGPASQDT